jgi:predicted GNAT superfamily acetyltransferase
VDEEFAMSMAGNNPQSIIIRDIEEISELRQVEEIQKEVWGIDDREVFPALALIPMIEVGAVLIGAFDEDRMAGFVFGFPGLEPVQQGCAAEDRAEKPRAVLHSDMLAVRPEYRSLGLGYKLKLAQRERALAKGIDTITWTFDPLQSLNAHLNFNKLGVIADRYLVNYYGETTSFLHSTGTDRLWVTWLLRSERVENRVCRGTAMEAPACGDIQTIISMGENHEPVKLANESSAQRFFAIEVPPDINRLLSQSAQLARRWREATRDAFTIAIASGFIVSEFYLTESSCGTVGRYLLTAKTDSRKLGTSS